MKVRGRDVNFLRTVKTTVDLADLCPNRDLSKIDVIFQENVADAQLNAAKLIHIMAEGYEMNKHFDDPTYKPNPISVEEILYLDNDTFSKLLEKAMHAFEKGAERMVETEEQKGAKKKDKV